MQHGGGEGYWRRTGATLVALAIAGGVVGACTSEAPTTATSGSPTVALSGAPTAGLKGGAGRENGGAEPDPVEVLFLAVATEARVNPRRAAESACDAKARMLRSALRRTHVRQSERNSAALARRIGTTEAALMRDLENALATCAASEGRPARQAGMPRLSLLADATVNYDSAAVAVELNRIEHMIDTTSMDAAIPSHLYSAAAAQPLAGVLENAVFSEAVTQLANGFNSMLSSGQSFEQWSGGGGGAGGQDSLPYPMSLMFDASLALGRNWRGALQSMGVGCVTTTIASGGAIGSAVAAGGGIPLGVTAGASVGAGACLWGAAAGLAGYIMMS